MYENISRFNLLIVCLVGSSKTLNGVEQAVQYDLTYTHPPLYQRLNYLAHSTYFKLSECEDVSIIHTKIVKLGCFLCRSVSYVWLQR